MYKIKIKGEAKFHGVAQKHVDQLNGIDCQDEFSEYFDGDEPYADDVTDGYLRFEVEGKKLYSITEYNSTRELTQDELNQLGDYTQGQWSDGIGEGFEQYPCMEIDGKEVFISPWFGEQKLEITQELI
jgi:hypothetical protein